MERKNIIFTCLVISVLLFLNACKSEKKEKEKEQIAEEQKISFSEHQINEIKDKVERFAKVKLEADVSTLTEKEKKMLPLLFETAKIMDSIFWKQAYGKREELLSKVDNEFVRQYININYGPWDRLNNNEPFIPGIEEKPMGANFYPSDMTKEEFESFQSPDKASLYTLIRRDEAGNLRTIPYHEAYEQKTKRAADLIQQASEYADDEGLKKYLELRAKALLTDEYFESDVAWMDMKTNTIDFIVGPIENYEDRLYGYKAAHESFILLKDKEWSSKLDRFAGFLPALQQSLPVSEKYKQETPGSSSDLGAYQVLYYAGDCNAGSKTIAINLPNDEKVRNEKGSRKLQLKNAMRAKFDMILLPISKLLIDSTQQKHITFTAFFENTMFHEVAHGLGISQTINDKGTVRKALKEQYSAIEEGKADILGLYLVTKLYEMGELTEGDVMDNFVTFMAGIFRSVRFGVASSHGKANMIRFYYFQEHGAFNRDEKTGVYSIDFEKMKKAMETLAREILIIQGDGNYEAAKKIVEEKGYIRDLLEKDLQRIEDAGIPVDIKFEQGLSVPGL